MSAELGVLEERCLTWHDVYDLFTVQCERELGHGGAHRATIDDAEYDPNFTYVVSWWPRTQSGDAA